MSDYKMPLPRAAFGAAAVALSAATLALAIYLPASQPHETDVAKLAAPHVEADGFREVNIEPARILVVGSCPQEMAVKQAQGGAQKDDQSS